MPTYMCLRSGVSCCRPRQEPKMDKTRGSDRGSSTTGSVRMPKRPDKYALFTFSVIQPVLWWAATKRDWHAATRNWVCASVMTRFRRAVAVLPLFGCSFCFPCRRTLRHLGDSPPSRITAFCFPGVPISLSASSLPFSLSHIRDLLHLPTMWHGHV